VPKISLLTRAPGLQRRTGPARWAVLPPLAQTIESIFVTAKGQLDLEGHLPV